MQEKKEKKRFPWLRCFLVGIGMATFISCGLAVVDPQNVVTSAGLSNTICHFITNIVIYTLVAAFFTWIYKAAINLLTRTDFIDYHPTDDVKKDKEQNTPTE